MATVTNERTVRLHNLGVVNKDRLQAAGLWSPDVHELRLAELDGETVVWHEREVDSWELDFAGGSVAEAVGMLDTLVTEAGFAGGAENVHFARRTEHVRFDADREFYVLTGWKRVSKEALATLEAVVQSQRKMAMVQNAAEQRQLEERLSELRLQATQL